MLPVSGGCCDARSGNAGGDALSVTRRDFLKHATFLTAVVSLSDLPGCGPIIRRKPLATAASKTVADVDGNAIRKFATGLHGRVILPADPDYESARHVWNWAVDTHPGMIARCADSTLVPLDDPLEKKGERDAHDHHPRTR